MNSYPMEVLNPTINGANSNDLNKLSKETINSMFNQSPPPWRKKEHTIAPWFMKAEGKIMKYDAKRVGQWNALVSFSHTIVGDTDTWKQLGYLSVICFVTMGICLLTNSASSQWDEYSVVTRVLTLLSFVFAGYVGIVINRWDRVRNTTIGGLWGALENTNLLIYSMLRSDPLNPQSIAIRDKIIRYSRLVMRLTFYSVSGESNLDPLCEGSEFEILITPQEKDWLEGAMLGTRPLVVVSWISCLVDSMIDAGYPIDAIVKNSFIANFQAIRGGIGATLGVIGAQLPYAYVHLVHWTVQISLASLAVETGVNLAVGWANRSSGNGNFSPPANTVWPHNSNIWFLNNFIQITAQNMVFAIFSLGLLKICDKLWNPLSSEDDTSFSPLVFDRFIYNNCRAMCTGYLAYSSTTEKLKIIAERNNKDPF
eukprot:gene7569-10312_t